MIAFYADSSVLVKQHIAETGTAWVRSIMGAPQTPVVITNRISAVEVVSALSRRVREGTLNTTDYARVVADFTTLAQASYAIVEVTPDLVAHAQRLLERHPLRAYDAVQLASALASQPQLLAAGISSLTFLSADTRLLHAAAAEGLATDNPQNHP